MIHGKLRDHAQSEGNSRVDLLKIPAGFPAELKDVVQNCWRSEWARRPDMTEIEDVVARLDSHGLVLPV